MDIVSLGRVFSDTFDISRAGMSKHRQRGSVRATHAEHFDFDCVMAGERQRLAVFCVLCHQKKRV